MPTNVTPEYKKAEAEYRKAREPADRLHWLKEMMRLIPRHKGTEHLQADIKTRIKELTEELAGPRKGGARTGPTHVFRPEGAAQVALIGPPNTGKSSLHTRLTGSTADVGEYPYTTQDPLPGMFNHEDVQFQLIDLPPVDTDFMVPWMPNAVQPAHAALLVVDLRIPGCVENVVAIRDQLAAKRISLVDDWGGRLTGGIELLAEQAVDGGADGSTDTPAADAEESTDTFGPPGSRMEDPDDPFRTFVPTVLVANKCDLGCDPEEIEVLLDLAGVRYPAIAVSANTGTGLAELGALLFRGLGIVRVYTKPPGGPPDYDRPFTVFRGDTVHDVATLIHRDIAASLKFARLWGGGKFDGQQVGRDHQVRDGDVLELHSG